MNNNLNILHKQNHVTLPHGWISTNLGKIVTFEYGKGLTKDKRDSTGKIPVYGSNGLIGYHCKSLTKKPCIIVGRKGAAGAVHISSCPCWPIDTTYYVEPPEGLNLNFLYYLLSILQLPSLDKSTAIPGLNRDDAYAKQVHIPPIEEQKRIVSKLETLFTKLDAGIEYLKKTQVLLKQYRQSVLKHAFEGKLTENWRKENKQEIDVKKLREIKLQSFNKDFKDFFKKKPSNNSFVNIELKDIKLKKPEEWIAMTLESACTFVIDCPHSAPKFTNTGRYCIDTTRIKNSEIIWSEARKVSEEEFIERNVRMKPREDDILFRKRRNYWHDCQSSSKFSVLFRTKNNDV